MSKGKTQMTTAQQTRKKVVNTLKFYDVKNPQIASKIVKNMARRNNIEFNTTEEYMEKIIAEEVIA